MIHRGTYAFRIPFIAQRRWNAAQLPCFALHQTVNFLRGHAFPDILRHIIKHCDVHKPALPDARKLLRILYHASLGNHMSLQLKMLYLFIKCLVALFVFPSAAAPAGLISSYLFHYLPHIPPLNHNCRLPR